MATSILEQHNKLRALKYQQKKVEKFAKFLNQVTLFKGKKGKGKSLAIVAAARTIRELFGLPTVVIGSKLGLNQKYGEYIVLDEKQFIQELEKITTISKDTSNEDLQPFIESTLKKFGVSVYKSLLIFDEAYKLFDSRSPSDKLVKVFGYFIAQSRHYGCTIFMAAPEKHMLDKRVREQIDVEGNCSTTCKTVMGQCVRKNCPHITRIRFRESFEVWRLRIYAPNFWNMYNSWTAVGFRDSSLQGIKY